MTYPETTIADTINERFVPLQINTKEEQAKPIVERYHQVWTPDLRLLDGEGYEYERWNGYLPPFEFLPRLLVAAAQSYLRQKNFERAAATYEEVLERFPTSQVAAEACYYAAVANYRQNHEQDKLMRGWERLRQRYPESVWRLKQTMVEDKEQQ